MAYEVMSTDELVALVDGLQARLAVLEQEKADLEVLLDNTTEHSDYVEEELLVYVEQVGHVTDAAAAVEVGSFDPTVLSGVAQRTDALGQLARVFQRMAGEVAAREQRLKHEVQQLRVEIDMSKQAKQVAEITETDYFKTLQERVGSLRSRRAARDQ